MCRCVWWLRLLGVPASGEEEDDGGGQVGGILWLRPKERRRIQEEGGLKWTLPEDAREEVPRLQQAPPTGGGCPRPRHP